MVYAYIYHTIYVRYRSFDKSGCITASSQLREAGIEINQWFKRKGAAEHDDDVVGKLVGLDDESGNVFIAVQGVKGKLHVSAFLQDGHYKWTKTSPPVQATVAAPSVTLESCAFIEENTRCAVFKAVYDLYIKHSSLYSKLEVAVSPKPRVKTVEPVPAGKLILVPATPWVKPPKDSLSKGVVAAKCTKLPDKYFVLAPCLRVQDDADVIPYWFVTRTEKPNMSFKQVKVGEISVMVLYNPQRLEANCSLAAPILEVDKKPPAPILEDIEYIVKRRKTNKGPA